MGAPQEGLTPLQAWLRAMPIDRRTEFAPVELEASGVVRIPCDGGETHFARVVDDRLVLDDHDRDAELALMVFGAEPPLCLVYEAVWHEAATGTFLTEWASDPDDDRLLKAAEDWYGNYWESWPTEPSAARVLFGRALQRAAAISAARSWIDRRGPDGPGSAWADVRRAISTRARRAIVLSLAAVDAHRRPDALVPVAVIVVPEGEPDVVGVLSRTDSFIEVRLPVRWLWDVWARGAVEGGRFVLDADHETGRVSYVEWTPTGQTGRVHVPVVATRV